MSFKVKLPVLSSGAHYMESFNWWLQDANGQRTPADLTGYEAVMDIRKGSQAVLRLTTGNGYIKLSGNTITFDVPADVTRDVKFQEASYDLLLLPGGDPTQAKLLMYGQIEGYSVGTVI